MVIPGSTRTAWIHGREGVYQARIFAELGVTFLNAPFLAERFVITDELYPQPRLGGNSLGILVQLLEKLGHGYGVYDVR